MHFHTRTKIVATLGPATMDEKAIRGLIRAGADLFRCNAAHTGHAEIARITRLVRQIARDMNRGIGVLVDLQGPKIRIGALAGSEPIWLQRGQVVVISTEPNVIGRPGRDGEPTRIGCGYPKLAKDVSAGERILLDDGNIELRVEQIRGRDIETRVVYGGLLKQFKGVNLPGTKVSASSLSRKDLDDLACALACGVDYIAQSFVRSADDIVRLKQHIAEAGSDALVVAKIERPEAVRSLASILAVADAIMVARGDMGVELGPEVVPSVQKRIIRACQDAAKPVITATQMLESMITNPRPTRAEASDVANAIYDGTSAVMLSAETASGRHPIRAVRTMTQIIRHAEDDQFHHWEYLRRRRVRPAGKVASSVTVSQATVRAAAYAALESGARLIAVLTESGTTANLLAAERTPTRLVAFTPSLRTVQRLALIWGVVAHKLSRVRTSHEMGIEAEQILKDLGYLRAGDRYVFVSGTSRAPGLTNTVQVRTVE
jgi:pyruvate kinase